ncbi:MAG: proprotein convertase P-domain-containing protein, partial [Planctomyces sp.]
MQRRFDAPLPDLQTVSFQLDVADPTPVAAIEVGVQLKHSYIGDLLIKLLPPGSSANGEIVLWNRSGGNQRELNRSFDSASTPALAAFAGKPCTGQWTLKIQDMAREDSGTLALFSLKLVLPHRSAAPAPQQPAAAHVATAKAA